jgi:hypothetical protein
MIFEFQPQTEYDILHAAKEHVCVKIWRQLRRRTYEGMKQPIPKGAIAGLECVLRVTDEGRPCSKASFELSKNGCVIQRGVLGLDGDFYGLKLDLLDESHQYSLKITEKNEP